MGRLKFLFVYPDVNKNDKSYEGNKGAYYYGIAQLSAVLKKNNIDVALLQYTLEPTKEQFLKDVAQHSPDIIGFSATTMMVAFCYEWAAWLRQAGVQAKLIIGGCHASESTEDVMAKDLFDAIFVGEAEDALQEYCQQFRNNPTDIKGTVVKKEGVWVNNGVRQLELDLDSYPFPDWEVFDYEQMYDMTTHKRGIMTASRGCPYKCSFCSIEKYHDIYKGKGMFVRFKSVDYVIQEAKAMKKRYPSIKYFHFVDDVLVTRVDWMKEFSEKWPHEVGMEFFCNVNANSIKEKTVEYLAKAGCRRFQIGVETGNEDRRKNLLKKPVKNEKILSVVNQCHKYGITVNSLNMIGLPYETEENILETIKFNAKLNAQLLQCCVFYPFPNTSLYNYCKDNDLLKDDFDPFKTCDYFSDSIIAQPYLTNEALGFYRDYFKTLVKVYRYINVDWLIKLLPYSALRKIFQPFKTKNELKKWLFKPRTQEEKHRVLNQLEVDMAEC